MRIPSFAAAALLAVCVTGCPGDPCPGEGVRTGTLEVEITGLPSGVAGQVMAIWQETSASPETIGAGSRALVGGDYRLVPVTVAGPAHGVVRTAYAAAESMVCVRSGQTATVSIDYAAVATSGKLWAANGNNGEPLVGFDAALLAASGNTAATVNARTRDTPTLTFDRDGNVWTIGGTTVDPTLNRYAAGSVATASRTAQIEIDLVGSGCSPWARAMAFDSSDNLWVAMGCEDRVVRIPADQLLQSGTVTPGLSLTGVEFPSALAFDATGNLWVAADGPGGTLHQYTPSQLRTGAAAPVQSISVIGIGAATDGAVEEIAFDASGNLWATVEANYNFARFDAAQLAGTGIRSVAPAQFISVGVGALPHQPALDGSGRLWFGTGTTVGRLSTAQMASSSTYAAPTTPEVVLSSTDLGAAQDVSFYPAPAGLPLRHSLP